MRATIWHRLAAVAAWFLAAGASAGEPPVEAEFSIPKQTQVMRFVACEDALFASVRYDGELIPNPYRSDKVQMVPERRSALVCWDLQGKLRWNVDLPEAYQLVRAGDQVILAYDGGGANSERGLIYIDAASGRELQRAKLEGRPCDMRYYPGAKLVIIVVMPQKRLQEIQGSWMETVAHDLKGSLAWRWKEACSELYPLCFDGRALAVGSAHMLNQKETFVARLDPATGKELWRQPWRFADPPGEGAKTENPPGTLENLLLLPDRAGVSFLDMGSGKLRHRFGLLDMPHRVVNRTTHLDRLYLTSDDLKGVTLAAVDFPSGKVTWTEKTGTVSYRGAVAWGENVVFMARRLSEGLTGRGLLAELRIYSPEGKLLAFLPREPGDKACFWDDAHLPQPVGKRLYVSQQSRIVALGPLPWTQAARR